MKTSICIYVGNDIEKFCEQIRINLPYKLNDNYPLKIDNRKYFKDKCAYNIELNSYECSLGKDHISIDKSNIFINKKIIVNFYISDRYKWINAFNNVFLPLIHRYSKKTNCEPVQEYGVTALLPPDKYTNMAEWNRQRKIFLKTMTDLYT